MKLLKVLLYLVLALVLVFVIGGYLLPGTSHVERSITIDRPATQVYTMLNSFKRFNEWSPWYEMEPEAMYSYSGPESGVGAAMAWEGKKVGSGSQRIVESVAATRVVNALDFGGSQATATYALSPDGNGTRITWSLDSEHGNNLVSRWFGPLMERMVGPDFEHGLAKLKTVLERDPR